MEVIGYMLTETEDKPAPSTIKKLIVLSVKTKRLVSINQILYKFDPPKTDEFLAELDEFFTKYCKLLRLSTKK